MSGVMVQLMREWIFSHSETSALLCGGGGRGGGWELTKKGVKLSKAPSFWLVLVRFGVVYCSTSSKKSMNPVIGTYLDLTSCNKLSIDNWWVFLKVPITCPFMVSNVFRDSSSQLTSQNILGSSALLLCIKFSLTWFSQSFTILTWKFFLHQNTPNLPLIMRLKPHVYKMVIFSKICF